MRGVNGLCSSSDRAKEHYTESAIAWSMWDFGWIGFVSVCSCFFLPFHLHHMDLMDAQGLVLLLLDN